MHQKIITLITPSLTSGGMERVMATLANNFQNSSSLQVHLVVLTGGEFYYELDKNIKVYQPAFDYKKFNRFIFTIKILFFLRTTLKLIQPDVSLSFGGKYNSFVLLSSIGLKINTYISERSRPDISYGLFLDVVNPLAYRLSAGIIAQTGKAKEYLYQKTKHGNIKIIGNPIKEFAVSNAPKKNVIINVGRFISSKHQDWLVDYFNETETLDWELWFLGDGPLVEEVSKKAQKSAKSESIHFLGNQKDIETYYSQAAVFAFTSTSEGFPNALGEAMRAGCACISFDCNAGPSELICDGKNGWLIPIGNHAEYKSKLSGMIADSSLRQRFSEAGITSVAAFNEEKIAQDFLSFLK